MKQRHLQLFLNYSFKYSLFLSPPFPGCVRVCVCLGSIVIIFIYFFFIVLFRNSYLFPSLLIEIITSQRTDLMDVNRFNVDSISISILISFTIHLILFNAILISSGWFVFTFFPACYLDSSNKSISLTLNLILIMVASSVLMLSAV